MSIYEERNRAYRLAQREEANRRRSAGLVIESVHENTDHGLTQDEFMSWYFNMFKYETRKPDEYPIWNFGTRKNGKQIHSWLVPTEHHKLICQLAWSQ